MPEIAQPRVSLATTAGWFAMAFAIALADQLSKLLVLDLFFPGESLSVTGFFNLVLVFNTGAAFSFLAGASGWQTPLLIGISALAIVALSWMLWRNPSRRLLATGLSLILGGAIGNLVDRVAYGKVVDFLDFHAFGWHWPAFNVADSAICVGAALLIIESFMHPEPAEAAR